MNKLVIIKLGSFRTINYTGEMNNLGDTLAHAAEEDPELERQITAAALLLERTRMARSKGEEMMEMILNPQRR